MNHIENIEIKNFKSIRHARLDGCRRINVLVGPPNAGKSNVLEALGLYTYVNESNFKSFKSKIEENTVSLNQLVRYSKFSDLFFDGDLTNAIEIHLADTLSSLYGVRDLTVNITPEELLKFSFSIKSALDNQIKNRYAIKVNKSGECELDYYEGKRQLEYKQLNIKKYDFRSDFFDKGNAAGELLSPNGQNLFALIAHNKQLRDVAADLFKQYGLKLFIDKDKNDFKLAKPTGEDIIYLISFQQIADTLQRLLFHIAATISNNNAILLFEEPEAHMYPPYISKFTSEMIYENRDNQYFLTTHSPFVLNDIMENVDKAQYAIYTVGYNKENGETLIHRITDEQIDEMYQYGIDLFFNMENYLKDAV
jgi:AAA15 family ATPase/GTPase